jgi:hypothetical protein
VTEPIEHREAVGCVPGPEREQCLLAGEQSCEDPMTTGRGPLRDLLESLRRVAQFLLVTGDDRQRKEGVGGDRLPVEPEVAS